MRQMSCWGGGSCQNFKGRGRWGSCLPVGFIQNDQLMPALREGHLFLRKAFDAVAHNVNT